MRPARLRLSLKKSVGWLLILLVLSQLLLACGEDNKAVTPGITAPVTASTSGVKNTAATTAATATPPRTTNVAVPTPTSPPNLVTSNQTLTLIGGNISTLDPALAGDTVSSFFTRQIFSGLLTLDKDMNPVPDLALAMPDVSADGTVFTFRLRPGLKFHSGAPLTADDIKYSWERAADPKLAVPSLASSLPAANYMNDIVGVKEKLEGKATDIEGIKVLDSLTLQVKTDAPKPFFLAKMTSNTFMVVNKATVSAGFDKPDGSGPFKVIEYRKDEIMRLARNPEYQNGAPNLIQVNILLGSAASNPLTLYEQGKIDFVFTSGNDVERYLDKNNPLSKELVIKPQLDLQYVGFNNRLKPFDDPRIRQAFSLVVDRARIARVMFESRVVKADSILPPGMPGYSGNTGSLSYDINRARDLIAQSSYRSAQNLPKITIYSTGTAMAGLLQQVYQQAFGIEVEVRQPDYKDFQAGLAASQFQIYIDGWAADYPDPENFLRTLLGNGSAYNDSGYNNAEFDNLLKQGDEQRDAQKRLEMYAKAEQIALTDAPILPLYHSVSFLLVKPYVKGLELTSSSILSLKDVYIVK
ncbi:MAG: peptide ABC transporter substrate-binding protein [Chloroflexi bacterium]|uniref:Peptide ABC transporter substrate-binding protein n=1 Tax=Candidatus Chlorohelix allophototropha TaxID=3003348 RepID=A0A8T7LZY0_9CHLR|nr:peptide ABC transporter substrate-binding protein [Chloroflexota bacterium]WJW66053.1 peptide ABC transporter substrate-binding protein [Chloroflexota bacterium L227-S17]